MLLRDKKIIFLLPPKTGSTSFKKMISDVGIEFEESDSELHPFLSEIITKYNINDLENYKVYQLCRNPFDRIASSFYFQKKIIKDKERYSKFIRLTFDAYVDIITKNSYLLPNYVDSFCKNVFDDDTFSKRHLPSAYGIRFYIPQTEWGISNIRINYLKIEEFDSLILQKILNIDKKLNLPKLNLNQDIVNYKNLYNEKTIKMVIDAYLHDFEILNYYKKLL